MPKMVSQVSARVEGTTVVSETVTDSEPSGGIPGYPLWSIGLALLLVSLIIARSQKH